MYQIELTPHKNRTNLLTDLTGKCTKNNPDLYFLLSLEARAFCYPLRSLCGSHYYMIEERKYIVGIVVRIVLSTLYFVYPMGFSHVYSLAPCTG